jgi:hypothetical protein
MGNNKHFLSFAFFREGFTQRTLIMQFSPWMLRMGQAAEVAQLKMYEQFSLSATNRGTPFVTER